MRDLTNERFGMLLVESQSEEKHKSGSIIWNCVCDCGNQISLPSPRLIHSGKTIRLGHYDDFELACFVREEAELKYYGFTKE